jgi:hypothetical protein
VHIAIMPHDHAGRGASYCTAIRGSCLYTPTGAAPPHTFHTEAKDTATPLPFESPPQLQLTGRSSGTELPEHEILFKKVFPSGDLATRECLLKFRTIASEQVRSNLVVALNHDDHGDPITMVTRRISPSSSVRVTTKDVKIRLPSAEVARVVYHQQR